MEFSLVSTERVVTLIVQITYGEVGWHLSTCWFRCRMCFIWGFARWQTILSSPDRWYAVDESFRGGNIHSTSSIVEPEDCSFNQSQPSAVKHCCWEAIVIFFSVTASVPGLWNFCFGTADSSVSPHLRVGKPNDLGWSCLPWCCRCSCLADWDEGPVAMAKCNQSQQKHWKRGLAGPNLTQLQPSKHIKRL